MKRFRFFVLISLVFLIGIFLLDLNRKNNLDQLKVSFLDIGQGDATLLEIGNGNQILIDGGPSGEKLTSELEKVIHPLDKTIEVVVLTHPDSDHLTGLLEVLKNFKVEIFLDNGEKADSEVYRNLETLLQEKKINRNILTEGSEISFDDDLILKCLSPDQINKEENSNNRNNNSVVLRLSFGENNFLFAGDIEEKTEEDLIFDDQAEPTEFLKIAHHGSKNSTSEKFLNKLKSRWAIISAGKGNSYGHPHQEILDLLKKHGVSVLRTDLEGTITFICDKKDCVKL